MYFAVFTYRPRSKIAFASLVVLVCLTQLIAWVIRSTYEVFNYNGCSYTMTGYTTCSGKKFSGCLASLEDCEKAYSVINLFTTATIYPLVMIIYLVIFTAIFYFCSCSQFGLLRCQQFLWFVCYCICTALFFITASNLGVLASSGYISVNSQLTATSIVLGLLCVLIVVTIIFINFDLNAYLKYTIYQPPPTIQTNATIINQQVTYTNVQLHTQQPSNNNVQMQNQIQRQELELRNLQLQMELQQRNSLILQQNQMINSLGPTQQQYYQPGLMGQPVPNQQQEPPVQGVPFQEVEIR